MKIYVPMYVNKDFSFYTGAVFYTSKDEVVVDCFETCKALKKLKFYLYEYNPYSTIFLSGAIVYESDWMN